jgi:hypothetical protein
LAVNSVSAKTPPISAPAVSIPARAVPPLIIVLGVLLSDTEPIVAGDDDL